VTDPVGVVAREGVRWPRPVSARTLKSCVLVRISSRDWAVADATCEPCAGVEMTPLVVELDAGGSVMSTAHPDKAAKTTMLYMNILI
jgi:hypothetical protein